MSALGFGFAVPLVRPRGASGFDFTGGALPAGATLSRGSAGTVFDAGGGLASLAANVARFDHDPLALAPRGLLIEPAATNLLLRSAEWDNGAWARAAVTAAADQDGAPDGTAAADLITVTATGHFLKQTATVTPGATYTFSFWAKRGTATALALGVYDSNAPGWIVAATTFYGQTVAGGYRRVGASFVAPAGCTSAAVYPTLNGTALGTFYAWGAQLEAGAQASSHVATGAATATRAADALVLNWGAQGVADGAITVRYSFDDASTQDVATTVAGGVAAVPTNLNRRWLRRADRV